MSSIAKMAAPPKKKKWRKWLDGVLSVVIVLLMLLVFFLMYTSQSGRVPFIGSFAIARIQTPSMTPTIPTGSYILIRRVDAADVKVGDVIVFYSRDPAIYGKANTHRVMEIRAATDGTVEFVTKGDHNPIPDTVTARAADVCGRYQKNLPLLTGIATFLMQPAAFALCVLVPAGVLVLLCVLDLVRKSREVRFKLLVQQEVERMKAAEAATPGEGNSDKDASDSSEKE